MTRPQGRPERRQLSVGALAWLVRQACGEQIASCRRKRSSRAREVHDVVTASGARLVVRAEGGDEIGLDQEAWFLARARRAGVPAPEVWWVAARGDGRAVLCHGDLIPDHIFVASTRTRPWPSRD